MKVINEKDYTYLGRDGVWHVFETKPKANFDKERLYEYRARFVKINGESIFFDPIKKNKTIK